MAVDADTKKFLDEAKKGKPRRFVMICKGMKILSLIVYKKGSVEKYKKQAKKEGKGQFYYGLITGKGVDITFNLQRSDGFDKPPGKDLILKDFLKTEADMKLKPSYEIVEQLPAVPFEEEDLKDPLIAKFMKMEPVIKKACDTRPESTPEIEKTVNMIRNLLLDDETRESAGPEIDQFVLYLKDVLAGGTGASTNEGSSPLTPATDAPTSPSTGSVPEAPPLPPLNAEQFKTRLRALLPRIKKVAGTDAGNEAKLRAGEAGVFAQKKDFEQANALLDQAVELLDRSESSTQDSSASAQDPSATDWKTARESWQSASDTVDDQISSLQSALKNTGDEELAEIADFGLNAITGNFKVPLMTAIREIDTGTGEERAKAASKALEVISGFRQHITSSEEVTAVDENPFGVKLTIRSTLLDAFKTMETTLQTMTA